MVVGFNHNVMYKGEVFHVQTEDSGIANPHIVTLIYREGTIIAARKTSYADIIKVDNLERVVEELMKEQHKGMLRRLKNGEFDAKAFPPSRIAPAAQPAPKPALAPQPASVAPPKPPTKPQEKPSSLDDVILDFLLTDDK
ncbi:hypothetical protein GeomeDRAFT_0866 [Geobacter metallireducens RCH3]|uniref:Uncharacterized protein n=1 Tax=Geobacter metallireducens (strain ATCC 53774 / DSM 7210 / GS-15) TaxID=269799 RepID=Q39Y81_GEOMG|nr:hypothetical protein [Geobacter metallireducens]ABB30793.1 hypothetical protein Gmet_0550 [Geobacter metallireducens GS-15]EHP88204.1 hypothetical protein GeomeDRAFT_0866 [Geobacter metallireducens RCH3]